MIRLCINNLTSDANFLSKTARCRRIALASLPHIGVLSVMVTGAPLVFLWAFPYNGNHHSARNICFLLVSLRGVGNEQSITVLGLKNCSHLLQKRWEFLYPSEKRKGMGEKNFFFPYRNESRTLHSQLAVSLSPVMVGERVHAFSKLKNTAPTFSLSDERNAKLLAKKSTRTEAHLPGGRGGGNGALLTSVHLFPPRHNNASLAAPG